MTADILNRTDQVITSAGGTGGLVDRRAPPLNCHMAVFKTEELLTYSTKVCMQKPYKSLGCAIRLGMSKHEDFDWYVSFYSQYIIGQNLSYSAVFQISS